MPLFDSLLDRLAKFVGGGEEPRRELPRSGARVTPAAEPEGKQALEPEPKPEPEPEPEPEQLSPELRALMQAAMELPKAVAVGIVDLETRALVAVSTNERPPQAVLDRGGAAIRELFELPYFGASEGASEASLGDEHPSAAAVEQIIMLANERLQLFRRIDGHPQLVLTVLCQGETNLGLTLARLRMLDSA